MTDEMMKLLKKIGEGISQELLPKMKASEFIMLLADPEGAEDVFLLLQAGAALMLNKPIIVVALNGYRVPYKLRMISEAVIETNEFDDAAKEKVRAALAKIVARKAAMQ